MAETTSEKTATPIPAKDTQSSPNDQASGDSSQVPVKRKIPPGHAQGKVNKRNRGRFNRNREDQSSRWERNVDSRPMVPEDGEQQERRPKKKVACFIGYSGEGYHGMQYNPPMKTIEGDIYEAFAKAGVILKANAVDPSKSSFQRAARTDKGVHAAGNLISLKLMVGNDDPNDFVDKINAELPPQIRIWGIQKTNNSFNSHTHCDSRIYEYIIPSHCFLPPKPGSTAFESASRLPRQEREVEPEDTFWDSIISPDFYSLLRRYYAHKKLGEGDELPPDLTPEEADRLTAMRDGEKEAIRAFRISPGRLGRITSAFKVYLGTHNFHNFTIGVPYQSSQAQRYMRTIDISPPKLIGSTEWIGIKIHGQSFMLHQIRKMVGAVLVAIRYGTGEDAIRFMLRTKENMHVPKAPAQGLLLQQPVFSGMSEKLQKFGNEALSWEPFQEKIEKFKDEFIYHSIFQETTAENVFHEFINFMDSFQYDPEKGLSLSLRDRQIYAPGQEEHDEDPNVKGDNEG